MVSTASPSLNSLAILGGTFNPLHFGHLRLGIEIYEALAPDRLDFVPTASPPHKKDYTLLPFDLRYSMIQAVVDGLPDVYVNAVEARRKGPSYTCETLRAYRNEFPQAELYFILGSEDFLIFDSWKDWRMIPSMVHLAVAARQGGDASEFSGIVKRFWPEAQEADSEFSAVQKAFTLPEGGRVLYLPIPRLDINSSLIRSRWLEKRSIDFWVPKSVRDLLQSQYMTVRKHWLA